MKSDKGHLTENKDYGAPVSAISYFSLNFFFTSSTFLHDFNFPFLHDVNFPQRIFSGLLFNSTYKCLP